MAKSKKNRGPALPRSALTPLTNQFARPARTRVGPIMSHSDLTPLTWSALASRRPRTSWRKGRKGRYMCSDDVVRAIYHAPPETTSESLSSLHDVPVGYVERIRAGKIRRSAWWPRP